MLSGGLLGFWKRLTDLGKCSRFKGRFYHVRVNQKVKVRTVPLEILRVVTENGEPVVGYKAVSSEEMQWFKQQLLIKPGDPEDAVVKKWGTAYYDRENGKKEPSTSKRGKQTGKKRAFNAQDLSTGPGY
jgi:hypothetical protein